MNPDSTIRPWLLACSAQFGIRYAFDHHWPDAETRQREMYFVYKAINTTTDETLFLRADSHTEGSNDITRKGCQEHKTIFEITLHNSQNGLYELAACAIGAKMIPAIQNIFKSKQCAFHETLSINNESFVDNEEVIYKHVMLCDFYERVELSITEVNAIVDDVKFNLESGSYEWTVNSDGYE
jgi:hypothetical protein